MISGKVKSDDIILSQAVQCIMSNTNTTQWMVQIQALCKAVFQERLSQVREETGLHWFCRNRSRPLILSGYQS